MAKQKVEDKNSGKNSKEVSQEAAKNISAGGNVTIGDIQQITQYIQKHEIEFLKRTNLKDFKPPYFPKLNSTDKIIERIAQYHVLVLGGSHADKMDLAWSIIVNFQLSMQSSNNSEIYEWKSTSDARGLIEAIRKQIIDSTSQNKEFSRIFVLLNLVPQDIELEALQKVARENKLFIIATTDSPPEKWSLNQSESRSWIDSNKFSYQPDNLAKSAIARIPDGVAIDTGMKTELYKLVAEQLKTVAGVDACVDWLRSCKQAISLNVLNAAIKSAKEDKKERLKKWFRALTSREQLLALGITLFNGLYTDQFFTALERVVERGWQKRDPSLQALDHCDLENLGNYCEFSEVIRGDDFAIRRLTWKDPETGKLLLGIAWESHRRQIVTALKEIIQIIQDSAQENLEMPADWQIYGTPLLQERLYESISEPFAEVGLVTAEATATVRDLLLALASNRKFAIQNFVATVLALWYRSDSGKLIRALRSFYDIAIYSQSNQQDPASIAQRNHIGATVALAISYASLNDFPNQLHPELCDWLTRLSNSNNSLICTYFGTHTLAYVVPRHLPQVHLLLKEVAQKHSDFSLAIAQSLAAAYHNYPDEVLNYLKEWVQDGKQKYALLCTIARTYGLIDCHIYPDKLTPESAFEQLEAFLSIDKRQTVRKAVIEGMSDRLRQDCSFLAPRLLAQVSKITRAERNELVSHITTIYLTQRAQLTGGDDFCKIDNVRYQIWLNADRPLTEIEKVMFQWLGQSRNRMAQQIATQAAIEFARVLELDEDTELTRLRNRSSALVDQNELLQDKGDPFNKHLLAPVAAWLATLQEKVYQPTVQNILPEALIHHTQYRAGMDFVLRKWEKKTNQPIGNNNDNLKLKQTAGFLRRGLWVIDNKIPLMVVSAGVAALGVMTVHNAGSQIIDLLPKSDITKSSETPRKIDGGIPIGDGIRISDTDSPNFDKGELKVSFTANGTPDELLSILNQGKDSGQISINGNEIMYGDKVLGSFTEGNGEKPLIVTLNAEATPEATEALIHNIAYKNNSTTVTPSSRTVQFVLNDGKGGISKPFTRKISLIAKNQAPAISAPETLTIREGNPLNYGKILISDPDSQAVTVQLSANNGILSVQGNLPKGVKAEEISGNDSKAIELKGALEKIKTTLANPSAIKYKPDKGFTGDDALKITVIDNGPTIQGTPTSLVWPPDAGKPQQTSKIIKITVIPIIPPLVISLPENKIVNEEQDLNIGGIRITPPNSKDDRKVVTVTVSVANGSLKVNSGIAGGLKSTGITGNQSSSVTIKGEIATINATLADPAAIIYRGKQNDSLKIQVDDGGRRVEKTLAITVNHVNQAPQLNDSPPVNRAKQTSRPSQSSSITKEEALNVIRGYLQAKREIFAPPFSREAASRHTTGVLYGDIVQPGKAIDSLIQKNQYYQYGNQQLEFLGGFVSSGNSASINVLITEEVTFYENGNVKSLAQNNPKSYQFDLRLENGTWKIFDYKEIK